MSLEIPFQFEFVAGPLNGLQSISIRQLMLLWEWALKTTVDFCAPAVQVDAIVYLVDAADRERFPESARELSGLLSDDGLSTVPFLVLGNKIDLPQAVSEDELRHTLGLAQYTTGKGKVALEGTRPIEVFMCSVVSGGNRNWED